MIDVDIENKNASVLLKLILIITGVFIAYYITIHERLRRLELRIFGRQSKITDYYYKN